MKRNNRIKIVSILAFLLSVGPLTWIVYGNDKRDITYRIEEEIKEEGVRLTLELTTSEKVEEISRIVLPDGRTEEGKTSIVYEVIENGEYSFKVQYKMIEEANNEVIAKEEIIRYQVESINKTVEDVESEPIKEETKEALPKEEPILKEMEEVEEVTNKTPEVYADYIEINEITFPDINFRNWIINQSYGVDNKLTNDEINKITTINIGNADVPDNEKIKSLKGIEYFTALTYLDCNSNLLTELDISSNSNLRSLYCYNNRLTTMDTKKNTLLTVFHCARNNITSLDLSANTVLVSLSCYTNALTSLDVSKQSRLLTLQCYGNQISSLDVSNNINLETFRCDNNPLNEIDITKNTALKTLYCGSTGLTNLDITNNTNLIFLDCSKNQISTLDISLHASLAQLFCAENQLTKLDISNNNQLTYISCSSNKIAKLNLTHLSNLEYLYCHNNRLTELDVTQNTKLIRLHCYSNRDINNSETYPGIRQLDVSNSPSLQELSCHINSLTSLDVSQNIALTRIECHTNFITSLDVRANTLLKGLWCYKNPIDKLDVSQNTVLETLSCYETNLESLDVRTNTELINLLCHTTGLSSLDITNNQQLVQVLCYSNNLTALDVTNNPLLATLACQHNAIESLNLSNNLLLKDLRCYDNKLNALDVSQNSMLGTLYCSENFIKTLNLENNKNLTYLWCHVNQLSELDLSQNVKLNIVYCNTNQLTKLDVSQNTELVELKCFSNQISSLDLSNQQKLTTFVGEKQRIEIPMTHNNTNWSSHPDTNYVLGSIDNTNMTYSNGRFSSSNTVAKSSNFTTDCIDGKNTTRQISGTLSFTYNGFVPVSNILDVPKTIQVNQTVTLSRIVEPSNATEKNIIWSIKNAGTTNAMITDNNLTVRANGTLVIRATIPGGTKTGDYIQDFTIVTYASPSAFVSIPTNIELEKAYHDETFEAVKEEQVSILSTTDTNVFDSNFYVRTEPTFHLLNTVDKDEWFTVQIYNEDNNKHTSKDMPLAILNSTRLSQRFYVKAVKDITRQKGVYKGTMNFVIGYGENQ